MRSGGPLAGFLCLIAASAVSGAPLAPAGPPAATVIPDNASRLSRLIYPSDKVVEIRLDAYDATIANDLKRDPQIAALLAKAPGLLDALSSAGRSVFKKHLIARTPILQQQFAQFYARNFSPAEIDQLIAFYSSSTGAKLISGLLSATNVSQLIAAMPASGDEGLTPEQQDALRRMAAAHAQDQFTADDQKALRDFAATAVHAKLGKLRPEFHALLVSTEEDPGLEPEMDRELQATAAAYLAKVDKGEH